MNDLTPQDQRPQKTPRAVLKGLEELPVTAVKVGKRLRPLDPDRVAFLVSAITTAGCLQNPVDVRKARGRYTLIDGAHRLAAFKELGHDQITVKVWDCSKTYADFLEAEGNISVGEMCPLERALHLKVRKDEFAKLFPCGVGRGGDRVSEEYKAKEIISFDETWAKLHNITSRAVRLITRSVATLSDAEVTAFRALPFKITQADLLEFANIEAPETRANILDMLACGQCRKVADAVAVLLGKQKQVQVHCPLQKARELVARLEKPQRRSLYELLCEEFAAEDATE